MTAVLTVLGSGTLLPDHERHSAAFLIEEADTRILLDCGTGVIDGFSRFGLPWADVSHVALTHFHTDHIGGLAPLVFALNHGVSPPRTAPLTILGPHGTGRVIEALALAHGSFVSAPSFELSVVELTPGERWTDGRMALDVCRTHHTESSVAYRWTGRGGTVGYTGDTGESVALMEFLVGSDLLIVECSHGDPSTAERHLTPSGVASLAGAVAPDLVMTTHVYPPLDPERVPELVQEAGYHGRVIAARDGMRVALAEGTPVLQ